jgi:hypothetical protein
VIVIESGIGGGKGELMGARLNAGEAESSSEGYGRSEGLQRMSGVVEGDRDAVYRPGPSLSVLIADCGTRRGHTCEPSERRGRR